MLFLFSSVLLVFLPQVSAATNQEGFEGENVGDEPSDTFYTYGITVNPAYGSPTRDTVQVDDGQTHSGTRSFLFDVTNDDTNKQRAHFNTTVTNWDNTSLWLYFNTSHKMSILNFANNSADPGGTYGGQLAIMTHDEIATTDSQYIWTNDGTWSNTSVKLEYETWQALNVSFNYTPNPNTFQLQYTMEPVSKLAIGFHLLVKWM